ncbi:hypothetical protein [Hymenobacter sp. APR13]|uniref:hypothetical protein n=1 Tax=Hymenobacter sp. APR13 TaxID=1356852 RepID=UPI0012E0988C|nr:hypothetical protein [Hymenobacter sp. APR13]
MTNKQENTMYTIANNLGRISFHDSSIEAITRANNLLTLSFDWAKVQDYGDGSDCFDIVVGKCCLTLDGVMSEAFLNHGNAVDTVQTPTLPQVHLPIDVDQSFPLISVNTFSITASGQCLSLGGVYEGAEGAYWLEYRIQFQSGCLNWNNHVTAIGWRKGYIPQ